MIKVLAIDDEPLALKQLATYIKKIPFFELIGECQSAHEAKVIIDEDNVDAIFCDINMPDLNGMDFVKSLSAPPIIVFTTAYSEYAIESYKVNATDYLLKPFGLDDFKRAANKIKKQYDLEHQAEALTQEESEVSQTDDDNALFLKTEHKVIRIEIDDIRYIEGMSEYLKIHLDSQSKPIIVLLSMKRLEEHLPKFFMRIHRSYIINLKKIQEVNKSRVIMGEDLYIPIGDLYRESFTKYLNTKFLGK